MKAQTLYKEDEGKDGGMMVILDVKIFSDLELSCDIPLLSRVV